MRTFNGDDKMFSIFNRQKERGSQEEKKMLEKAAGLESNNYLTITLSPVSIMDDKTIELLSTSVKITYDDFNPHQLIYGDGKIITCDNTSLFTVQYGDYSIDHRKLIFVCSEKDMLAYFLLTENQIQELEQYYNKVNQRVKKRIKEFKQVILDCVKELKSNPEVFRMCYNFIQMNDLAFFYDPEYIAVAECILRRTASRIGEECFICPQEIEIKNIQILEELKSFFGNDILNLFQILAPRYGNFPKDSDGLIDLKKSLHIIWNLLRSVAEEYLYNSFVDSYKNLVATIDNCSFEESIYLYFKYDVINSFLPLNIAQFACYLLKQNKLKDTTLTILDYDNQILKYLTEIETQNKLRQFEEELLNPRKSNKISISDIDLMSGLEFENFTASLFSRLGFKVNVTKASGDQGIDIIAEKDGKKFGIQAKCYSSTVSNRAIQEVVAGINHYNLDKGIVVTNNFFTDSAITLAKTNNIILWDRNILKEKMSLLAL